MNHSSNQGEINSKPLSGMSQVYDDFYDKMVDLGRIQYNAKKRGKQKSFENKCFCPDLGPFQILFGWKKSPGKYQEGSWHTSGRFRQHHVQIIVAD